MECCETRAIELGALLTAGFTSSASRRIVQHAGTALKNVYPENAKRAFIPAHSVHTSSLSPLARVSLSTTPAPVLFQIGRCHAKALQIESGVAQCVLNGRPLQLQEPERHSRMNYALLRHSIRERVQSR